MITFYNKRGDLLLMINRETQYSIHSHYKLHPSFGRDQDVKYSLRYKDSHNIFTLINKKLNIFSRYATSKTRVD